MKIVKFTAENIKKLKAVEITPKGNMIQVTGKNASGKTSVLDAIWWALGGADNIQAKPLREGAKKGRVCLDLGDFTVERRFMESGNTSLLVENKDGARYPSPQAMLDKLTSKFTLDPLEFIRMKPKQQFEMIRQVSKVDFDFDADSAARKKDFEARTDVNRDVKMLEGQVAGCIVPEDAPLEAVDTVKLMAELDDISAANKKREAAQTERKQLDDKIAEGERLTTLGDADIIRLEKELQDKKDLLKKGKDSVAALWELHKLHEIPEAKDDAEVKASIAGAQEKNTAFATRQRRAELDKNLKTKQDEADALTKKLEDRDTARLTVLQGAEMPIAGLTFGADEVLLNGIPFTQLSSAEQLRASIAVAMAANPELRIIRVQDGSLLDEDGLKILADMTAKADYQVWCECVDSSGKVGVYMEDGEVVADNQDEAIPAKESAKPTIGAIEIPPAISGRVGLQGYVDDFLAASLKITDSDAINTLINNNADGLNNLEQKAPDLRANLGTALMARRNVLEAAENMAA